MASVLHGSARTTPRLRAEFQASKEILPGKVRRERRPKNVYLKDEFQNSI